LDIIQKAIETLNVAPPEITIEARFVEVSQNDSKAIGFDWYLGNTLLNNGSMGLQGGTAPSFGSRSTSGSAANPLGIFPGNPGNPAAGVLPTTINPSTTDQLLTGGLRNALPAGGSIPTVATFTGILTDPQFRVALHLLEQRDGADVLYSPKVTTVSGRQTQMQAVEVRSIVVGNQTQLGGGGGGGAAGTIGQNITTQPQSAINPQVASVPLGPVLDVIPYVSADGYSVQMTIIPQVTEFLGYDTVTAQQFRTQVITGSQQGSSSVVAALPLPIFRSRQAVSSCIVWDGQTVVLGGLMSETVSKTKDKVPVLGDIPFLGRLFRSESSTTQKKNLIIFVTPRIIDPAGNPVHTMDNLPYDPNTIPPQKPIVK